MPEREVQRDTSGKLSLAYTWSFIHSPKSDFMEWTKERMRREFALAIAERMSGSPFVLVLWSNFKAVTDNLLEAFEMSEVSTKALFDEHPVNDMVKDPEAFERYARTSGKDIDLRMEGYVILTNIFDAQPGDLVLRAEGAPLPYGYRRVYLKNFGSVWQKIP